MDILNEEDDQAIERFRDNMVQLPSELENAPEDVKDAYIKWVQATADIKSDQGRYFSFISETTHDVVTVDAMWINGRVIKLAQNKGINKNDLVRLRAVVAQMDAMKKYKSTCKYKWAKWLRPHAGRSVLDWHKSDILDLYAHYKTHEEVKKWLEDKTYEVNQTNLIKFFMENRDIIDKKRMEFLRSNKDHYLATDAGRMESLAMLHAKFMILFQDNYDKPKVDVNLLKNISAEIRGILEQARKEIKGDELKLTIDGKIDINASMQASLTIQEISRKIPINMIPIFLVAAKRGINPINIIASLTSSFYKDFNGFGKLTQSNEVPQTMDLIRNYNWNDIEIYHKEKPVEREITIAEYEEIPFTELPKIQSKREKLAELLKQQLEDGRAK